MSSRPRLRTHLTLSLIFLLFFLGVFFKVSSHPPRLRAAITTHHLLAQSLIVDLGEKLATTKSISRLVIIGPNHDEVGNSHLLTDNQNLAKAYPFISYAPDLVNNDHACFVPREILQQHLPSLPFSCLLISSRVTPVETTKLANTLRSYLSDNGFLVASVDFSHYLPKANADQNDQTTLKYLSLFDDSSLLKLGNNYLDSPYTISVLFKYLHLNNISRFNIINHLNSAQILNTSDLPSTTSYFEIIYY